MNNKVIVTNCQWENWIDYAKAISIFMIVYCHSLDTSTAPSILTIINQWGCAFHVPVFFILSGYLFRVKENNFKLFFKNSFRSLLIPYIFFNVISGIILLRLQSHETWIDGLFGFFLAKSTSFAGPAWFLVALFWIRLIMYGIIKMKLYIMRIVTVCTLGWLFFYLPNVEMGIRNAFVAIPFFFLGMELKRMHIYKKFSEYNISIKTIIILFLFLIVYGFINHTNLMGFGYARPTSSNYPLIRYFSAIMACMMLFSITSLFNKYSSVIVKEISKCTITIMGLHIVILQIIWAYGGKLPNFMSSIVSSPCITITTFLMSLIVAILLKRYVPFLVGNRK